MELASGDTETGTFGGHSLTWFAAARAYESDFCLILTQLQKAYFQEEISLSNVRAAMASALARSFIILNVLLLAGCRSVGTAMPEVEPDQARAAQVAYAWVQLGAESSASARAILTSPDATCPKITVDHQPAVSMSPRAIPSTYSGFRGQITVCELDLKAPVSQISIDDDGTRLDLPPPTGASGTVLVVGDTGCRLEGSDDQRCIGGSLGKGQWGFPTLSASAAGLPRPDLVLHVGDYLYRESTQANGTTCDPYDRKRGWVHCGDNWPAWEDDFFAPAGKGGLLRRAPWIYVRGNHENCSRSWQGYFLFFYPLAAPASCEDVIDPYPVQLSDLDIYVVDTSNESASSAETSFTAVYDDLANTTTAAWLATHVPTVDLTPAYADSKLGQRTQLKWLHVGHIHFFQHQGATEARQAETVTGGSGTELSKCATGVPVCSQTSPEGCCYGEVSGDKGQYSFLTIDFDAEQVRWNATLRDVHGKGLHTFSVE